MATTPSTPDPWAALGAQPADAAPPAAAPTEKALNPYPNPEDRPAGESLKFNQPWAKPGPYLTKLSPDDEAAFQTWAKANPKAVEGELDNPKADYDVRGHWLAAKNNDPEASLVLNKWDGKMHGSDKFKTPYNGGFSNESMYATPDAPRWKGDKLYTKDGRLVTDETPAPSSKDDPWAALGAQPADAAPLPKLGANISAQPAQPAEDMTVAPPSWAKSPGAVPDPGMKKVFNPLGAVGASPVDMTPQEKAQAQTSLTNELAATPGGKILSTAAQGPLTAVSGVKDVAQGQLDTLGGPQDQQRAKGEFLRGAGKIVGGGGQTALMLGGPQLAELGAAAGAGDVAARIGLLKFLGGVESGNIAGQVADKVAEHYGFSQDSRNAVATIAQFVPSILGEAAGLHAGVSDIGKDGRGLGVSAFGGKVKAGIGVTPEAYGAGVEVGGKRVNVNIARGTPEPAAQPLPSPAEVTAKQQADTALSAMLTSNRARAAAEQITKGVPPQQAVASVKPPAPPQPPQPAGMEQSQLRPEVVADVAKAISYASPEQRGSLVMEAHENLAKWVASQGRVLGPDGQVHITKNPEQAQQLAAKWVNDAVAQADQQRNDAAKQQQQQPQPETPKTEPGEAPEALQPAPAEDPQERLYQRARTLIGSNPKTSIALLQRNLGISLGQAQQLAHRYLQDESSAALPTVGSPEEPVVEESRATVDKQVQALKNGTVPVVFVPKGSEYVPAVPQGFVRMDVNKGPGAGTYLYNNKAVQAKTIREAALNGTHGDLLGHIQTKQDVDQAPGGTVVRAQAPDGTPIQDSVVAAHPAVVATQAQVLAERHPGADIVVKHPDDVLAERVASHADEQAWNELGAQPASEIQTGEGEPEKPEQAGQSETAAPAKYKYGNTQAEIPEGSEAGRALKQVRDAIPEEHLAGKGKDVGGSHITVRYGIKGDDASGIRKYLEQQTPFEARLGKTDVFPPSEHSEGAAPVHAAIEAPELHRMNAQLEKHGDFAEPSFDEYKPHATIAYVKPEVAEKYKGMADTEGKTFPVRSVTITDRNGNEEVVPLRGGAASKLEKGAPLTFTDKNGVERTGTIKHTNALMTRIVDKDGHEHTIQTKKLATTEPEKGSGQKSAEVVSGGQESDKGGTAAPPVKMEKGGAARFLDQDGVERVGAIVRINPLIARFRLDNGREVTVPRKSVMRDNDALIRSQFDPEWVAAAKRTKDDAFGQVARVGHSYIKGDARNASGLALNADAYYFLNHTGPIGKKGATWFGIAIHREALSAIHDGIDIAHAVVKGKSQFAAIDEELQRLKDDIERAAKENIGPVMFIRNNLGNATQSTIFEERHHIWQFNNSLDDNSVVLEVAKIKGFSSAAGILVKRYKYKDEPVNLTLEFGAKIAAGSYSEIGLRQPSVRDAFAEYLKIGAQIRGGVILAGLPDLSSEFADIVQEAKRLYGNVRAGSAGSNDQGLSGGSRTRATEGLLHDGDRSTEDRLEQSGGTGREPTRVSGESTQESGVGAGDLREGGEGRDAEGVIAAAPESAAAERPGAASDRSERSELANDRDQSLRGDAARTVEQGNGRGGEEAAPVEGRVDPHQSEALQSRAPEEDEPGYLARAAEPVRAFLSDASDKTAEARALQEGLYDMDSQDAADVLRAIRLLQSVPGNAADHASIYHHIEDSRVALKAEQSDILDRYIEPIRQDAAAIRSKLSGAGMPVEDIESPNWVHRIVKEKGGMVDRAVEGKQGNGSSGNKLGKKASSTKSRTMMAVQGNGERRVVSIKNGRVTAIKNRLPIDMGSIQIGSPSRLEGQQWEDKSGRKWQITQATTKEIEQHTDLRYYHNALVSTVSDWLELRRQERALDFLHDFVGKPDFSKVGVKPENLSQIPDKWQPTRLPQLRGYYFEPRTAEVMDWYADKQSKGEDVLSRLNNALTTAVFVNPLAHIPNLLNHWVLEKGMFSGLAHPAAQVKAGMKAINAVLHLNDDYLEALDAGGPLQSQRFKLQQFTKALIERMSDEMKEDPTLREKLGKALDLFNPWTKGKNLFDITIHFSNQVTWLSNDILFLQAAYARAARGMPFKTALREVAKHIPDYRLPTRVLDSKTLGFIMRDRRITAFSAYRYGALKSYGETIKSLIGAGKFEETNEKGQPVNEAGRTKTGERFHGLENLVWLGLLTFAILPLLDAAGRKLTGDDDFEIRRAGGSAFPYNAYRVATGQMTFPELAMSVLTPAIGTRTVAELALNHKLYNGKRVYNPGDSWGDIAQEVYSEERHNYGPTSEYDRFTREGLMKAPLELAGVNFRKHGAMRVAQMIAAERAGSAAMTPEEKDKYHARAQALDALHAGDATGAQQIMSQAGMTAIQRRHLTRAAMGDELAERVRNFTIPEVERVMSAANEDEKRRLLPVLRRKIARARAHQGHRGDDGD